MSLLFHMLTKVLIVDDESEICFLLKRIFKDKVVITTESLTNAHHLITSFDPDILIMDVNLPDGNGAEEVKKLKEKKQNLKVILISGANDDLNQLYHHYKADAFIKKPFSSSQIRTAVSCF